jgi:hypothetical protein
MLQRGDNSDWKPGHWWSSAFTVPDSIFPGSGGARLVLVSCVWCCDEAGKMRYAALQTQVILGVHGQDSDGDDRVEADEDVFR